ncbi:MAG: adenine phosphoribosyltransferase [Candidatus Marinimicrobia bacterium]|nr:adenine phosphoribosyltransferase [Candidatus Neomarinimicrobiota bacterium]
MAELDTYIRTIPDFPKPGIGFKDITTLLKNPVGLKKSLDLMVEKTTGLDIDLILGIESRGFIFGGALADRLGVGFDLIRKPGKLPGEVVSESYELEYGTDTIEIHKDSIEKGMNVLLIDDLLATGGTMSAALRLVNKFDCTVSAILFLIELTFLKGREKLGTENIISLIQYSEE